jgi:ubiquinone/menaquinone biosynthesis C-methylase UbiE
VLQRFLRQFSGPRGPLGHVAGWLMVRKNAAANAWIVELLAAGRDDRVVEIGFGPGLAVVAHAARTGGVAGIDRSPVMLRQARRRAAAAGLADRVDLRLGSADALPFADADFSRAMALNSLQFWPKPEVALDEIHRVLAPRGRLVLGQRLRREGGGRYDRSRFGMTDEQLAALVARLRRAGFGDIEVHRSEIAGEDVAGICARR